jgi:DNA polymerase
MKTTNSNPPRATIDFETRSAFDIMKGGAWRYSQDPSTQIMCLAVRLPDWPAARLWVAPLTYSWGKMKERNPDVLTELFAYIAAGGLVEAHNAFFERSIGLNICTPKLGWPSVPASQWRCSAAKASMHSIPRSLGGACAALGLPIQKDGIGRKVMLKLCKPRKPRKAEIELLIGTESGEYDGAAELAAAGWDGEYFWHDSPEDLETLFAYCLTDVESEHGLSEAIADLPENELRIWQMDQSMNLRGVLTDVKMVETALALIDQASTAMTQELRDIVGDQKATAKSRVKIKNWLIAQGVELENTQGATLDALLTEELKDTKPFCHSVIRIVREVNRTSTAKYATAQRMAAADGRIRDLMMYHGASTGRWSGKGLQPHNFPRGWVKDMDAACDVVLTGDIGFIRMMYGEVIDLLSSTLRGILVASEGRDFMVADYAAIEARVIAWMAHAEEALDVFKSGQCIYMDMATSIYGYPVTDKKKQNDERQMGKQAILGLGFGMGFVTFLLTCHKYNIRFNVEQVRAIVGKSWDSHQEYVKRYYEPKGNPEDPTSLVVAKTNKKVRHRRLENNKQVLAMIEHELILMKHIVDAYRAKYPMIVQMWEDVEAAAVKAIQDPGTRVECHLGRCTFVVEDKFLKCFLPSGRALYYYDPILRSSRTPWGDLKQVIFFMGTGLNKQWSLQNTYGGKLVENITQAIARDLMAEAMLAADESGVYDVLLSVHDELIAEVDCGKGSVEEFEELMAQTPPWADGCPVKAEGWRGRRYRK